jgi:glucokinase
MPAPVNDYALAIDIGGTKIAAALVNREGVIVHRHVRATHAELGAPAILQTVFEAGREILDRAHREDVPVIGVGIGTGGQVNTDLGSISYASDTLPGWSGLPLADEVRKVLGLNVWVDNDVNAMALGELYFGAGRGYQEALFVAVGTGLGGAIVRQGQIWRGTSWTAGEICHMIVAIDGSRRCSCGAMGHLETYTSGPSIAARYSELAGISEAIDLPAVAARARDNDSLALQAIAEGATTLGIALGGLLNVLDPQLLVIGGGVPEIGELWWRPFESGLRANPMPGPARIALRRAELGPDAALSGAAWLAFSGQAQAAAR